MRVPESNRETTERHVLLTMLTAPLRKSHSILWPIVCCHWRRLSLIRCAPIQLHRQYIYLFIPGLSEPRQEVCSAQQAACSTGGPWPVVLN